MRPAGDARKRRVSGLAHAAAGNSDRSGEGASGWPAAQARIRMGGEMGVDESATGEVPAAFGNSL
jgi:hypothetical protein